MPAYDIAAIAVCSAMLTAWVVYAELLVNSDTTDYGQGSS